MSQWLNVGTSHMVLELFAASCAILHCVSPTGTNWTTTSLQTHVEAAIKWVVCDWHFIAVWRLQLWLVLTPLLKGDGCMWSDAETWKHGAMTSSESCSEVTLSSALPQMAVLLHWISAYLGLRVGHTLMRPAVGSFYHYVWFYIHSSTVTWPFNPYITELE